MTGASGYGTPPPGGYGTPVPPQGAPDSARDRTRAVGLTVTIFGLAAGVISVVLQSQMIPAAYPNRILWMLGGVITPALVAAAGGTVLLATMTSVRAGRQRGTRSVKISLAVLAVLSMLGAATSFILLMAVGFRRSVDGLRVNFDFPAFPLYLLLLGACVVMTVACYVAVSVLWRRPEPVSPYRLY